MRHSYAMNLLQSGVDPVVIALWLGHETLRSVDIHVHADITLKERALARTAPIGTTPGRYRPQDTLISFLESL
jgi:integrase/recombinase XerD